jgi:hypothetical protein
MPCSPPSSRGRRDSSSSALRSRCTLSSSVHFFRRFPRRLGSRSVGASIPVLERGCSARADWIRLSDRGRCPLSVGIGHLSPGRNGGDSPPRREPACDERTLPLHAKSDVRGPHDRLHRGGSRHKLRLAARPAPDRSGRARPHRGVARRTVPERCIRGPIRRVCFTRPALAIEDGGLARPFFCVLALSRCPSASRSRSWYSSASAHRAGKELV